MPNIIDRFPDVPYLMLLCVTLIQAYHKQCVYLQGGGGGCFIGSIIKFHAHLLKAALIVVKESIMNKRRVGTVLSDYTETDKKT